MDPRRRKTLLYIAGALLLVAVALLVVWYALLQPDEPATGQVPGPPGQGSGLVTATPTGDATAAPGGSEAEGTSGGTGSSSGGGLSASEAAALEAELSAIEKALDSMSMPGDSDFSDIESGLD